MSPHPGSTGCLRPLLPQVRLQIRVAGELAAQIIHQIRNVPLEGFTSITT